MATPSPTRDYGPETGSRISRRRGWGRSIGQFAFQDADVTPHLLDGAGIVPRSPRRTVLKREENYRYALVAADIIGGLLALVIALSALGTATPQRAALLALPLTVLLAKLHGLYDRDDILIRKTTIEEVPLLFQHATLATLVLVLVDEPLKIGNMNDTQAATLALLLFGFAVVGRMVARRFARGLSTAERVLVLGDRAAAEELLNRTEGRPGIDIVGIAPLKDLITYGDLCRVIDEFGAERLIVVQGNDVPEHQTLELVRAAKVAGVRVSLLPGILGVVGSQVEFDDLWGITLLGVRRFGLTRSSRALKRAMDIACALPLLIVSAPVLAAIAIAIRRDGGSIFYRQERVGRGGRRFQIVKLRTMVTGAEDMRDTLAAQNEAGDGLFKIAADPRITRIGAILRKTHLDELPQLWNVVRGEMSLVGPRPLMTTEDANITGLDRRRLELTPGMTGPWQIMGSHRRIPMNEMVKIDYLYASSWSLWNDLKILMRTVGAVVRRAGV